MVKRATPACGKCHAPRSRSMPRAMLIVVAVGTASSAASESLVLLFFLGREQVPHCDRRVFSRSCCRLRGQGPIWPRGYPGSLARLCTCLFFLLNFSPRPPPPILTPAQTSRQRSPWKGARPAPPHIQQQPGHLWSAGGPRARFCIQAARETSPFSQRRVLLKACGSRGGRACG